MATETGFIQFAEGSAPATPASTKWRIYAKTDGLYYIDDAGTEVGPLAAAGASGAPTDAEYVVTASNGTLSAEKVVAAPATGGNIPKIVRKTSNESVNASTTLQDDDELLFAIGASEVWAWEAEIWYDAADAANFKFAYTVPTSASLRWADIGSDSGDAASPGVAVTTVSGTARTASATGVGTTRHTRHSGVVVNSTNAGNVTLQWAQNTSNVSNATVQANSIIKCWKLA
jgi:hypothetical protein